MTLLKLTEAACGLAFVIGRFVPLATVGDLPDHLEHSCFTTCLWPRRSARGDSADVGKFISGVCLRKNYKTLVAAKIA